MRKDFVKYLIITLSLIVFFVSGSIAQDKQKGIDAVKKGDFLTGLKILQGVVKTDNSYEANLFYAVALSQTGSLKEAEVYFKKALEDDDEGIEAYKGLGDIKTELKDYTSAESYYKKALKIEQTNVPVLVSMAEMYLLQGKIDKGIEILTNAEVNSPSDVNILVALGNAYFERETWALAKQYFDKALKNKPNLPSAYFGIGKSFRKQKKFKEAVESFDKVISIDSKFAEAYYEKALILNGLGNIESSSENMVKYLELKPNSGKGKSFYGRTLYELEKYEEAISVFKELSQSDTSYSSTAYLFLGRIYSKLKSKDSVTSVQNSLSSIDYYSKAKQDEIEYDDLLNLGNVYTNLKNITGATAYFNKAIAKDEASPDAYFEMGKMYFGENQLETAVEFFQKAISKGMKTSGIYLYSGAANYNLKKFEDAARDLKESVKINENNPIGFLFLAKSLRALGNKEEAIANYQKVLTLDPSNQEASDAIKVLSTQQEPENKE